MFPAGDVGLVEGEMNVPTRGVPSGDSMEFNTLDEPIKETFVSSPERLYYISYTLLERFFL